MENNSSDWSSLSSAYSTYNPEFLFFGNVEPEQLRERNPADLIMVYERHEHLYVNGRLEMTIYGRISPTQQIKVSATSRDAAS